ncbi:MAG: hypothetical protein A2301_02520 [Candidatus Magasanikbacteria bacterium RIFOXYB2_FULL_40_13]|uniref:Glycosyltransferase RgtA/B/C/D-like domain-containing protein n=2 Tax=Candidatus Magasanikiibacteriota TaxID=1752731 RepID=A0A1F6NGF6_9BACT|nr:MAG: hypothetical protein A2224_00605 [Candidatus Magasanikbacteria bacterium RIFOXYA2_FULL_40_20]OGH82944.1 MAG: hypothetical protein A2373_04725 [Candidatus Magasanikbacteria bacterium RIFOXYB1_FULL_40_15]OGH86561.1 MAG: hypothetical protein A2301_02520 [Candidatus Magasanikbacteria bacterium RIFOXYB2_FULL_40_13]OGH87116.1 MAG: hypothetical protein A2206_02570 [Candidatus Magasanikbacteria bacterium RIFOXYA1_FULL_40_8]
MQKIDKPSTTQLHSRVVLGKKHSLVLYTILGAVLLTLNLTLANSIILGVIGLFAYIIPLALWYANLIKDRNLFFSFILLLAVFMLLNTASYYLYGITKLISLLIIILPMLAFFIPPKKPEEAKDFNPVEKVSFKLSRFTAVFLFLAIDIFLIFHLTANRTFGLMPSPWQAVEYWFFIFYAIATGLLFFLIYTRNSTSEKIILTGLHIFTTFAITAILYPLGYGFDAFVHRATEVWILNNGFISPKQPYYIGQYGFVVWLAQITKIPLFYIDIYLVPILASLTLPAGIFYSLKHSFPTMKKYAVYGVWLIPFIPFLSLHLTTPHNIALLFSILIVFFSFAFLHDKLDLKILLLLALAAICAHPLVGAPILIFVLAVILAKKCSPKKLFALLPVLFLILSVSLPAMFIMNNIRMGAGWPEFTNPLLGINKFFELFARPYWYATNTPLIYELLYSWQRLIVPVVIIAGIAGFIQYQRKNKNILLYVFPVSAVGFVASAWLLRSWVVFPDVVSYEQGDFPLRLVKASVLFLLPFVSYLLSLILQKIEVLKKRKIYLGLILITSSIFLMFSLYLSYPQRNIKARFPGLNVTTTDFKTVEWIHNQHNDYDYIVLANQLVSAAALTDYSFAKYFQTPNDEIFYYSVPTGGLLYKQYGKMLYEGQKREYMEEAMDLTGVKKSYFVINSYWANSDKIIDGAKKTADAWQIMDEGKTWIFIYTRD